jgi:ABC-2 type transport system permease protein
MTVMAAIAEVTARALLGRRRTLLMALIAAAPVGLALLLDINGRDASRRLVPIMEGLLLTTILPLIALVFGTAALGSEIDDGTAIHILTKPIPRWQIVVPKLAVAGLLTAAMVGLSALLTGLLIGGGGSRELGITVAFVIALVIGAFVYVAIFLALSAATSRGLVVGLAYSILWEGLLAGALPGTQALSVREYVRGIVSAIGPSGALKSEIGAQGLAYAIIALAVIAVLASLRLERFQVRAAD